MRILHIINGLGTGGAEKLIVDTIPLMQKSGISLDVLLLNGEDTPFKKQLFSTNSCQIISLGSSYYNPLHVFRLIKFLRAYDLVHVHLFPSLYFVALAKILSYSKAKLVFTEHNTDNRRMSNSFFKRIEQFIYKRYDKIICITEQVKQALIYHLNLAQEKLVVIENGINVSNIQNSKAHSKENFGFREVDKLLIMVAAFREQKDQDTIIKTISELPENYHLLLVGDGERRTQIEQLVAELDLTNRVHLLGIRSDVPSVIKMCDIAILSSHWEGFGLAAVEAMACGVPVIASNVDGLAQVIEGGGILFEKGNIQDLKNKIVSLEDENWYSKLSEQSLIKSENFNISKMINKQILLYNIMLNQS